MSGGVCNEIVGKSRVYPPVIEMPALVPDAFQWEGALPSAYLAVYG